MLLDQVFSSFTNFLASIAVARLASTADFGSFSVAFAVIYALLELLRPLALEPLLVRFSGQTGSDLSTASSGAVSTGLGLGLIGSLAMIGCAFLVGASLSSYLLVGSLAVVVVLVQDSCRFCLIAAGNTRAAAMNDGLWALLALSGVVVVWAVGWGPDRAMLAWAIAGAVSAVVGLLQVRVAPSPASCIRWLRTNRHLAPRFVLEYLLDAGGFQLVLLLVGVIGGLAALGALNGARILLGPVGILFLAISGFAMSEGARSRDAGDSRLVKKLGVLAVLLAALPLAWGAVLFALPGSIGAAILGETFYSARGVLLILALYWAARGALLGAKVAFRVSGGARTSLRVMAISSPVVAVASIGGALMGGGVGATVGLAGASVASAIYSLSKVRAQYPPSLGGSGHDPHSADDANS